MKRIRYLTIRFNNEIKMAEIPWFRGAVIKAAGHEHLLFHNHDESLPSGLRYAYPLIQYKRIRNKAALVCVEDGVEEIHAFFQRLPAQMMVGDRAILPEIDRIYLNEVNLQAWDNLFRFQIRDWLALKPDLFHDYMTMTDDEERNRLLSSVLRGNILSFAKGIGWFIDREVKVRLLQRSPSRLAKYKNTQLTSFDAVFETNVWLPEFIGLGKGASLGFGMVETIKNNTKKQYE